MYYLLTLVLITSLVTGCGYTQAVGDATTPSTELSPRPTTTAPQSTSTPRDQPTFAEAYVIRIDHPKQCTSGVLLGKDGLILTTYQDIQGARSLIATTVDGNTAPLNLLAHDRVLDLALLQTTSPLPEPEPLVWSARTGSGSPVFVLGFPFPSSRSISGCGDSVTVAHGTIAGRPTIQGQERTQTDIDREQ